VGEGLRLSEYVMCVGGFEEDGFVTRVRRVYGTMCVCVCVCVCGDLGICAEAR
jgi:hypothetical protein